MEIHRILSLSQLLSSFLVYPSHPFKLKFDLNCSFARPKYSKRHINLNAIYGYCDPGADENEVDKEKLEEIYKEDAQPSLFEREKENIDPELSDLISKQYEIQKNTNCTERLSKYDWFDDEPLDSSDEEFAIEYCETKVPDMNAIYKTLDPYGIRNYLPKNLTMADKSLGRVYDVGKPISEVIDKNETEEDEFVDLNYNGTGDLKEDWDPSMIADEPIQELDFGEFEDPEEEDVVMEDELCRYFVKLPTTKWTNIEGEAYNRDAEKFNRSNSYYKKIKIDYVITDFRTVFKSPMYSDIGIKDNQHLSQDDLRSEGSDTNSTSAGQADPEFNGNDASEKVALVNPSKLHPLYIMEYRHNDLLNDIDSYERSEYPKLVDQLVNEDYDKPTFTFKDITCKDDSNDEIGAETSIYIGVPKDIMKPDEEGSTIVNDSLLLRRNYTETVGKVIDNIPIKEQYNTAILLLPNELGYRDQNIRYLADELSINTNSIVFMPEISEAPMVYKVTLNRIIKFIQLGFNVDRLCIVALGNQGAMIINYLHQTMANVVSLYHQKDFTYGPKLTDLHLKRYHELTKRHTAPMIEDIFYAFTNSDSRLSAIAADRARDFNTVKPLSKILQSVILFDSCNVNITKMVQISTPILALLSNRNKLLEDFLVLNEDPDFIKQRDRVSKGHKMKIINAFKYCNEKKPDNLQELLKDIKFQILPKSEESEDSGVDVFRILSKNKGVDISINIYRHGSGYFYMKKPTADKREMNAIGASIMFASNWIRCWTT